MKRFNNPRRLSIRALALAFVGALTLGSCTKVDDTLGGNLIPDNQQMRAGFVTIDGLNPKKYVETRLFKTDSIVSSNISYGYFGAQMNDTLGERKAGFLSQMVSYYAVPEDYFGYMPIFDSAQIMLSISAFGTDTLTEQHFAVYEILNNDYITQKEKNDTTFYLGFSPDKTTVDTEKEPLFRFTLGGEGKYPSSTTSVTLTPTESGKSYIKRLMLQEGKYKDNYTIYTVDSLKYFLEEFPGLYIAPDPGFQLDKADKHNVGTIYATKLDASGLSIYGRNRVESDPSLIKDTIGMVFYFYDSYAAHGNVSVNSVCHDYTQITDPDVAFDISNAQEPKQGAEDTRTPVSQFRVEGLGGAVTEMTFTPGFFASLEEVIAKENAKDGKIQPGPHVGLLHGKQLRLGESRSESFGRRNRFAPPAAHRGDERRAQPPGGLHQLQDPHADLRLRILLRTDVQHDARLRRVCQPEPRMLRPQHHGIPPTDLELLHQGQERCGGHLSGSRRRRLRCKVCRLGGGYQLGRRQIQDRIHRTRGIQSLHELVRRVPGRFDRRQRTRLSDPVRPGIQPHQVKTRKTQPCET